MASYSDEKEHESSLEIVRFLSKAVSYYKENYPHISEQGLAKKIGVSVYFLSKFAPEKVEDIDLAKIDVLNLWKLIVFFKNRNILDFERKKEFQNKLENFLNIKEGFVRTIFEREEDNDEGWSQYERNFQKDKSYSFTDLDTFIVYSLYFFKQDQDSLNMLKKIFSEDKINDIVSRLKSVNTALPPANGKIDFSESVDPRILAKFLGEIPLRFFDHDDFGKARQVCGFYIGSLNDKGLLLVHSAMVRYLNEIVDIFKNQKYSGQIPVAFSTFMNAMIRVLPKRERKFSKKK